MLCFLRSIELFFRNHGESAVEIINAVYEVLGKFLDGEVFGCFYFARGSFLEIAEFGDLADVFVLEDGLLVKRFEDLME